MNALNANAKERAKLRAKLTTKIYKLTKGIDAWFWLCPPCLEEKKAKGWNLSETRNPPHSLSCDECKFKRGELR